MNREEAIAKIEENYTIILDRKEIVKKIIERVASNNQELALSITQIVKSLDYQKIIYKVKEEVIVNIKKLENEYIDFEDVKSKMVNAAMKEISDEVLRADEIDKITQEFKETLNYEKMMSKLIEFYTESVSSPEHKAEITKMITEHMKPLDYQKIVDEVKKQTIKTVRINQDGGLNYQDIVSNMQNSIKIGIKNKIAYEVEKCNQELKEKCKKSEGKRKIYQQGLSELEEQGVKLGALLESCAQSFNSGRNSREQTIKSLNQKVPNKFGELSKKLRDYEVDYESLKRGEPLANHETKEGIIPGLQETIIEIIDLYKRCPNNSKSYKLVPRVFDIINSNMGSDSIWKGFVINNFSKIIQFGFKNEEPTAGLLELVKKIPKVDKKLQLQKEEDSYQYVLDQHKEVSDQLKKLEASCSNEGLSEEFNDFIDFIYISKKKKEEQDRKGELQREKDVRELLEPESKETGTRPKQPQRKKKKNKSRAKNGNNNKNDKVTNEHEIQNSKEEQNKEFEDEEVKELREELKELIALLFSDERSKQFEDKVNKAIENHEKNLKIEASSIGDEKIKDLYVIKSDFHLRRTILSISHYNKQYGKIIERTKGDFGTNRFSKKDNKYITSNLPDIALRVQHIDADLKEVLSVLDNKMTPLVYKDYCQENDERCLQIISEEHSKCLNGFLDHLKALGEWHSNKTSYVQEHNIKSSTKTAEERKNEVEAFKIIKSCIDSLDMFVDELDYTQDLNNNQSVKSNKESPLEYYGPCQSWEYYGPHQQWCALSKVNIEEVYKLPEEMRGCSC